MNLGDSNWNCKDMDTAFLRFKLSETLKYSQNIEIMYQYEICNKCNFIPLKSIDQSSDPNENSLVIDSYYSYIFKIVSKSVKNESLICDKFIYKNFRECGEYLMSIDYNNCNIKMTKEPINSNTYLFYALISFIVFVLGMNLIERCQKILSHNLKNSTETKSLSPIKRIKSIDTFRGFSLFLMIFVNYGSGGYKFLQHSPWHGITIADFIFPWFLWIMGFSISLASNNLLKKSISRFYLFKKILIRSIKLFLIGIMLNSRHGVELGNLRIFGVLQRIALCYLIVATIELVFYKKNLVIYENWKYYISDIIWSKYHFLSMLIILICWFNLTFLTNVPGCPRGYMGPGGLDEYGAYHICTGGIGGYIDKLLIGKNHLYSRPTAMKIYKTTEPFDPEGLIGTFNSVILVYLGVQAGRILIFYKNYKIHLILWTLWSFICLILFSLLTQNDFTNGYVPVNKNLWTFSYTLITASSSFLILGLFYYLIDIKNYWSGNPFIYLGMNSILIYICHILFNSTIPNQWLVSNTHFAKVFMNLWGSVFWTLISVYFYTKKIFFNF